ncbi:MAG TPA: fused MFS/spermidine synthase [Burkholderiaceae bacterium]|nr:fused MFS/spermidine synthase [Burkholderiaceae bacterium]HQR71672.1 fused MFS/spermidine synthase [Burkholderiaceae bacterium]
MLLFASTILLSAFLLFLVQPIIAKQILPWFGGTSAVWITCLVFFQVVLLAGYTYAHLITRHLSARAQSRLHIALLAASLVFLPIVPSAALKPTGEADAALSIIVLLLATIGLPYFLLSTTGPLLQKWVAPRFPEKSVYRLFALSNFGSLIGLLAFPFAIEPFSSSSTQSMVWSAAYAVFVLTCGLSAWKTGQQAPAPHVLPIDTDAAAARAPEAATPPRPADYLLWLALSALGSVMLLATTSHITQNIASVPFLWVLPLSLYLLTFVVAFEGRGGRGWYEQNWWLFLTLALIVAMAAGLSAARGVLDVGVAVPLYTLGMFMSVLFCNGELAHRKPAPRYLTQFYLMISLGGALGGMFVGLVAPRIFQAYFELPLALVLLAALAVVVAWRNRWLVGPAIVATLATGWYGIEYLGFVRDDVIFMQRNFYGTLRVREQGSGDGQVRRLLHGVILHGEQFTINPARLEPGTYYARSSGVGRAIAARQAVGPVRIGVVGLGTGTLSAYGRAGDTIRFYELDPDVLKLARSQFDYLNNTPARLEFAIGDARLSLERELAQGTPQKFDVLAIDAFSSDSIPVHLITREAIRLYMQHLAPDGILAVHVSNRFLDLKPVLANIARDEGLQVRLISDQSPEHGWATDWVVLAATPEALASEPLAVAQPIEAAPAFSVWTDQFNNLLDVLKTNPLQELKRLVAG